MVYIFILEFLNTNFTIYYLLFLFFIKNKNLNNDAKLFFILKNFV